MERPAFVVLVLVAACGIVVSGALAAEQQTQTQQQTRTQIQTQEKTQTQTQQQTQTQLQTQEKTQTQTQEQSREQNRLCDCPFCGGLDCDCPFCYCAQNCYQWDDPLGPFSWEYFWHYGWEE